MASIRKSDIAVEGLEILTDQTEARTPLKFGGEVVEKVPFCTIHATVENGRHDVAEGWGGIFLMDQWGWPTPEVPREDKQRLMQRVLDEYIHLVATHAGMFHPIGLFMELEDDLARINKRVCAEEGVAVEQQIGRAHV